MAITLESAVYRWRFMGNCPVTDKLRHAGDVDELPVALAKPLVADGVLVLANGATVGDAPRGEPSQLIGINITEQEFALTQLGLEVAAGTASSPVMGVKAGKASGKKVTAPAPVEGDEDEPSE